MPVDGSWRRGHVGKEISTARLGVSFRYPSLADKTRDVDGGERVIKERIARTVKETGGRASVVGLGEQVRRRRRRCPLRLPPREK